MIPEELLSINVRMIGAGDPNEQAHPVVNSPDRPNSAAFQIVKNSSQAPSFLPIGYQGVPKIIGSER